MRAVLVRVAQGRNIVRTPWAMSIPLYFTPQKLRNQPTGSETTLVDRGVLSNFEGSRPRRLRPARLVQRASEGLRVCRPARNGVRRLRSAEDVDRSR